MLAACAERYNVSLIAATLKWLEYTERRAVIVVSRDDFILWARSSTPALKTGAFFRTSREPIPIPTRSLAGQGVSQESVMDLQAGVWFKDEPCREMAIRSEQYEFTISLLSLPNDAVRSGFNRYRDENEKSQDDLLDRIKKSHGVY